MQCAAVISWSRWPVTCPCTYLQRDSLLLLGTSMSVHRNQGEFLWPCRGQKTHRPLILSHAPPLPCEFPRWQPMVLISVGTRALPIHHQMRFKASGSGGRGCGDSLLPLPRQRPVCCASGCLRLCPCFGHRFSARVSWESWAQLWPPLVTAHHGKRGFSDKKVSILSLTYGYHLWV